MVEVQYLNYLQSEHRKCRYLKTYDDAQTILNQNSESYTSKGDGKLSKVRLKSSKYRTDFNQTALIYLQDDTFELLTMPKLHVLLRCKNPYLDQVIDYNLSYDAKHIIFSVLYEDKLCLEIYDTLFFFSVNQDKPEAESSTKIKRKQVIEFGLNTKIHHFVQHLQYTLISIIELQNQTDKVQFSFYDQNISYDQNDHYIIAQYKTKDGYPCFMMLDMQDLQNSKKLIIQDLKTCKYYVKNSFIVEVNFNQENKIDLISICKIDFKQLRLNQQFKLSPLMQDEDTFIPILVEQNEITYSVYNRSIDKYPNPEKVKPENKDEDDNDENQTAFNPLYIHDLQYIVKRCSNNKIYRYHELRLASDLQDALVCPFNSRKMLLINYDITQENVKELRELKFFDSPSIFKVWEKSKDLHFRKLDFEEHARFAFDDIVEHKVKQVKDLEPLTYAMVRDIKAQQNLEFPLNDEVLERWLGLYQNGNFNKIMRFEDKTLKNSQFSQKKFGNGNLGIECYIVVDNDKVLHSKIDLNFKVDQEKIQVYFKFDDDEKFKKIKIQDFNDAYNANVSYIDNKDFSAVNAFKNRPSNRIPFDTEPNGYDHLCLINTTFRKFKQNGQYLEQKEVNYDERDIQTITNTKTRIPKNLKIKKIKPLILKSQNIIQTEDNKLYQLIDSQLREIQLPLQLRDLDYKITSCIDIFERDYFSYGEPIENFRRRENIYLHFYQSKQSQHNETEAQNIKRHSVLKIRTYSDQPVAQFQCPFKFYSALVVYTEGENSRYTVYDPLTLQPVSFIETSVSQAEVRFFQTFDHLSRSVKLKLLKGNQDLIKQLLKLYPQGLSLLDLIYNQQEILQLIFEELNTFQKSEIPMLFLQGNGVEEKTCLRNALDKELVKCVQIMLNIFNEFQDHYVLNQIIDQNLAKLLRGEYDIQDILEKQILFIQIDDNRLIPDNGQYQGLYDRNWNVFTQSYDEQIPSESQAFQATDQNEEPICFEYLYTLMPKSFKHNNTMILNELSQQTNMKIFQIPIIQEIINYYWSQAVEYRQKLVMKQFLRYLSFMMTSILYSVFYKNIDENNQIIDNRQRWLVILLCIGVCFISAGFLMYYFIINLRTKEDQQESGNNYVVKTKQTKQNQYYFLISSIVTIYDVNDDSLYFMKYVQILILIWTFIQFNQYLRVYKGFSIMTSMLYGAFAELVFFVIFFIIFIVEFSLLFMIALKGKNMEQYEGLSLFGGYMMMSFRLSTGDFELDNYNSQSQLFILILWGIWILAVLALNMIFLNFIIAVISSTFDKVMESQEEEEYKMKIDKIVQCVKIFRLQFHSLVIKKPDFVDDNSQSWNGFMKAVKNTLKISSQKVINNFQLHFNDTSKQVEKQIIEIQTIYDKERSEILREIGEIQELIQQL
eukprot:403354088